MSSIEAPTSSVRLAEDVDVTWYRCGIERSKLLALLERSDLQGLIQAGGHLALFACTGLLATYFFEQQLWFAMALSLLAHGTVTSFFSGIAVHELGHGTVFRTKWLNAVFLRLFSLIGWWNHYEYAMSHTYHHRFTLHPRGDQEVVLPRYPSLEPAYLIQLFSFNVFGGLESVGFLPTVKATVTTAWGRYRTDKGQWHRIIYAGAPETERRRAVNWARSILAFHIGVLAVSIVFGLWFLPVVLSLSVFTGNWLKYFVGMPMHCGLRTDVPDFRLCVRTMKLDPVSEFLYWRMNWHLEHHMFAAVPCYRLAQLHRAVAHDMPEPRTLTSAWREMREIWRRQQADPSYQFDTPLPPPGEQSSTQTDPLAASIGELAPATLR